MTVQMFRKKPVVVEAMQLIDDLGNHMGIAHWIHENGGKVTVPGLESCLYIETREGRMRADIGDWIIREPFPTDDRRFYPCKPDLFDATYEPAPNA